MSLNISIEARPDYLNVLVTGAYDLEIAVELLGNVLQASIHHKLPKILIDYREVQGIPTYMTEDFIYAVSATQLIQKYIDVTGRPPRMAYLAPNTILEDGEYATKVAAIYGFTNVKRTTDFDEAMDWLGASHP